MAETNLALQLQVVDPSTDWESVMIGNSRFTDDMWDLRILLPIKTLKDSHKYLNFGYIQSATMKHTVKQYAYYKLGKVKPQTVRNVVNGWFPSFFEFCVANGISRFSELTQELYLSYNLWLKEKKVAQQTGYLCAHVVEEIVKIGQIKGWDVPKNNIFRGITANQLWETKRSLRTNKTRPIPSDIFDKILHHAVHDEKNVLTKAGIIIQSQTGCALTRCCLSRKAASKPLPMATITWKSCSARPKRVSLSSTRSLLTSW